MRPSNVSTNLIINRDVPPFNNPDIRRALALTLDRQAFIDILSEGQAALGGTMLPPPAGVWGMPPEEVRKRCSATIPTSNKQPRRGAGDHAATGLWAGQPAARPRCSPATSTISATRRLILSDQLKKIWFETEVEAVDTPLYYNRVFKKDYSIGLNLTGASLDDPDQQYL